MAHVHQHCLLQWEMLSKNPLQKCPESERQAIYPICENAMCKLTFPQTSNETKVHNNTLDLHV